MKYITPNSLGYRHGQIYEEADSGDPHARVILVTRDQVRVIMIVMVMMTRARMMS
jgi:hypothetical protein